MVLIFSSHIKQKLLQEIGDALNISSQEVASKFHSLRTQFNREFAREKKIKSGASSDETYSSKWEYMSSLRFLKINSVPGTTVSNLVIKLKFFHFFRSIFIQRLVSLFIGYSCTHNSGFSAV